MWKLISEDYSWSGRTGNVGCQLWSASFRGVIDLGSWATCLKLWVPSEHVLLTPVSIFKWSCVILLPTLLPSGVRCQDKATGSCWLQEAFLNIFGEKEERPASLQSGMMRVLLWYMECGVLTWKPGFQKALITLGSLGRVYISLVTCCSLSLGCGDPN